MKAACFEVGRAPEVAKGVEVPMSLAFSKLSRLGSGVFFFLVIFSSSGNRYMIRTIRASYMKYIIHRDRFRDAPSCEAPDSACVKVVRTRISADLS